MSIALKISFQLLTGALMTFTHAFFPSLFTTSASNKIKKLYSYIENRKLQIRYKSNRFSESISNSNWV